MIKKLDIVQFAGINNKTIEFGDGLNVIVGRNEAGKSSAMEALYASLFTNARIGNKKVEDKRFAEMAFPYENGDHAECAITFEAEGHEYKLHKLWHSSDSKTSLEKEGTKILDQSAIEEIMKTYLVYGEGTYSNVMFSKQEAFKALFEDIKSNTETVQTISQLMKNASMNLDGLSLEAYKGRLESEYKSLTSNWDMEKEKPMNNKSWQNPHKNRIGLILAHHYEAERSAYEAKFTEEREKELERVQAEIKAFSEEKTKLVSRLDAIASIEADVIKYQTLKSKLDQIENQNKELLEVNKKWPAMEADKSNADENIRKAQLRLVNVQEKLKAVKSYEKFMLEYKAYEKKRSLELEIDHKRAELDAFSKITNEEVSKLERLEKAIHSANVKLKSAELAGQLLKSNHPAVVTDVYGNSIKVPVGETWTTNAYMKLEIGEQVTLEIQSNQIDFTKVKEEFRRNTSVLEEELIELGASSVEDAKLKNAQARAIEIKLASIEKQVKDIPAFKDDVDFDEKKSEYDQMALPSIETLETSIIEIQNEIRGFEQNKAQCDFYLKQWQSKFSSHDDVAITLGENLSEKKRLTSELSELSKLPEEFSTVEEYLSEIRKTQRLRDDLIEKINRLEIAAERVLSELPERSSEEFYESYEDETQKMNQYIKKAQQLQTIMEKLEEILEQFKQDSYSSLERSFMRNLSMITQNRYDFIDLNERLDVAIGNKDKMLPTKLLSSGTLDSVALAFRLAIIDELGGDTQKLTVLDDCLVNMDEDRQKKAIDMIKNHAERHQVIFVTCHNWVAEMLGGNTIEM
ncbi:MAG: AAA family ATPase [Clostridiales bacterium]|nr:AAA family ATPase [Clostridiales bacterium]